VWPAVRFGGPRGRDVLALYMKTVSATLMLIIRLGGARVRRSGVIPTEGPALIVMNHQSLLDIPTAVLMETSRVSWFVTRRRYARFIPSVSLCLRLLRAPIIEPDDKKAALRALQEAARRQENGILIFPEGHRTRDGSIQPFHAAGLQIMLRERPVPVYLVVTDGFWTCRRMVDFVFNISSIDGRTEVLGPFLPPEGDLVSFVASLREKMVEHLAQMRQRNGRDAAA
jgi:1-acyl-sn-glycerol-3-phosphate acyltransferase